jgi:hypothetical protein
VIGAGECEKGAPALDGEAQGMMAFPGRLAAIIVAKFALLTDQSTTFARKSMNLTGSEVTNGFEDPATS